MSSSQKHDLDPDFDPALDQDIDLGPELAETEEWESGYAGTDPEIDDTTDGEWDLEARYALKRVGGLRTELEDITEVEYRQLRLERVVLVGVWTEGSVDEA